MLSTRAEIRADGDGQISDRSAPMTIAADVRKEGDGRDLALGKVVAALIGIPSDEIYRRAEAEPGHCRHSGKMGEPLACGPSCCGTAERLGVMHQGAGSLSERRCD
jgi:hypothetical protein